MHLTITDTTMAQVAEKLADQAVHFSGLAQDARRDARIAAKAASNTPMDAAEVAEQIGKLKEDAKYFQRAANANANALTEWRRGMRPELLDDGRYLLPSRTDGSPHLLTRDGDWVCTCQAGASDHWAKAMVLAIELVFDELDRYDDAQLEDVGLDTDAVNALISSAVETDAAQAYREMAELF